MAKKNNNMVIEVYTQRNEELEAKIKLGKAFYKYWGIEPKRLSPYFAEVSHLIEEEINKESK